MNRCATGSVMPKEKIQECVPILSNIFVKWRWLVTALVTISIAFGSLSYHSGRIIQSHAGKIEKNNESFNKIEKRIVELEIKIDTLIKIVKRLER